MFLFIRQTKDSYLMLKQFILVYLAVLNCAHADLRWDSKAITLKAKPGQASATVEFICHNTGEAQVEIDKVKTSCGCTSATISKKTIAPDEQGIIKGKFIFGSREGHQRKRFEVIATDGKRHILYLNVDIPKTYQLSAKRLSWNSAAQPVQSCQLLNESSTPIKIASVKSSSPFFDTKLKEVREGFEYQVLISPTGKAESARAIISILAESIDGHAPRIYKVYVVSK